MVKKRAERQKNLDILYFFYLKKQITESEWKTIELIRSLAMRSRKSQDIICRISSHSATWGEGKGISLNTYTNYDAERRWTSFLKACQICVEQGFFENYFLHIVVEGGGESKHVSLGCIEKIKQSIKVLRYIVKKVIYKRDVFWR